MASQKRRTPEIRDIIYAYTLEGAEKVFANQSSTPVLLAVVRCEEILYQEPLEIYFKVSYFRLDGETCKFFIRLDANILKLLKKHGHSCST